MEAFAVRPGKCTGRRGGRDASRSLRELRDTDRPRILCVGIEHGVGAGGNVQLADIECAGAGDDLHPVPRSSGNPEVDNSIRDDRMADRECVMRFFAFTITPYTKYKTKEFDSFLNDRMVDMNKMSDQELEELENRFKRAMVASFDIFGKDAFRKRYRARATRYPINKALFESWSVNLSQLSNEQLQRLIASKHTLIERFMNLMNNREFDAAVSQGTGDINKVHRRFDSIKQLIAEV